MKKKAFTLAEVLITLGIIGVVAALTMPSLVANYQKKVLETRIKSFYSVINQAVNMKITEDGDIDKSMLTGKDNPVEMEIFFDANYAPYMKTIKITKGTRGLFVALPNGSGMYLWKEYDNTGSFWLFWCVDYKKCLSLEEVSAANLWYRPFLDGKTVFTFRDDGKPANGNMTDRDTLLNYCGGKYPYSCAQLLMLDGWEIKDDYPW